MNSIEGVLLILEERVEQQIKHGRTVEDDVKYNNDSQLSFAASSLIRDYLHNMSPSMIRLQCPNNWNLQHWHKMCNKPYKERLIIAGALIAAEIDRVNNN